ncbi:methylated-DNA--[protein]-cysteine S-methyltransferase [Candidatus Peregrinibacteria bacterium]|nr:methylated-DNA--[protein]-cysteine S-methyltransferase [Candidatus Peregrinibacteria bacterium]MBI3816599.1 methylated-DNA--[protein]-cysteine S-methyltransferase [Candidatus Peregrinibacteria bacterium]
MMLDEDSATLTTPIGPLTIIGTEKGIRAIRFDDASPRNARRPTVHLSTRQCKAQMEEYFDGKRRTFDDLSFALIGTAFQTRVWEEVMKVPYGEIATYGSIAHSLRCSQDARAVGRAVGRNMLAIIIPCHRILPSGSAGMDRDSGEYAWGRERKEWLLGHESKNR